MHFLDDEDCYISLYLQLLKNKSTKGTSIKFIFKICYRSRLSGPLTASTPKWREDNTLRGFQLFFHGILHLSNFMQ